MANKLNLRVMRDAMDSIIELQPFHIQNWVAISGDGMTEDLSYIFSYSYLGAVADIGKQVFNNYITAVSDTSAKNLVIMTTHFNNLPEPPRNSLVYIYSLNGDLLGRFHLNFVQSYYVSNVGSTSNAKFKTELHLIRIQA